MTPVVGTTEALLDRAVSRKSRIEFDVAALMYAPTMAAAQELLKTHLKHEAHVALVIRPLLEEHEFLRRRIEGLSAAAKVEAAEVKNG